MTRVLICQLLVAMSFRDLQCGKISWVDYWDCWARRYNDRKKLRKNNLTIPC